MLTALVARRVHLKLLTAIDAEVLLAGTPPQILGALGMRPEKGKLVLLDRLEWQALYYHDIALLDDILRLRTLPGELDQPFLSLDEALALSRWPDAGLSVFHEELADNRMSEATWQAVMAGRRLLDLVRQHPLVEPEHYRRCLDFLVSAAEIERVMSKLAQLSGASLRLPPGEPPGWLRGATAVTELDTIRALLKDARLPLGRSLSRLAWVDSGLFRWTTPALELFALLDGPLWDESDLVSLDVIAVQRGSASADDGIRQARDAVHTLPSPAPSPDSLVLLSADRRRRRNVPVDAVTDEPRDKK